MIDIICSLMLWLYAWGVLAGLAGVRYLDKHTGAIVSWQCYAMCIIPIYGPAVWATAMKEVQCAN